MDRRGAVRYYCYHCPRRLPSSANWPLDDPAPVEKLRREDVAHLVPLDVDVEGALGFDRRNICLPPVLAHGASGASYVPRVSSRNGEHSKRLDTALVRADRGPYRAARVS